MLKKQFEFIPSDEVRYSQNGEFVVAKKLLMSAPSGAQARKAAKLEQCYGCAVNDQQQAVLKIGIQNLEKLQQEAKKHKKESAPDVLTCAQVLDSLRSANTTSISDALDAFGELVISGVCLIDGKIEMQTTHFNELSYSEQKRLLGEYVANFFS